MPMRVQNFSNETSQQSPNRSMPHFSVNAPQWWNSHGQNIPQSLSRNLSLKVGSPSQPNEESNQLTFAPRDKDSSSSPSTGQSDQEDTATEKTDSQDQCISSDSVQDGSYRKCEEGPMKSVMYMGNPTFGVNHPQVDNNMSMAHFPYAYSDPYFNGLYNAYGPQAMFQPQIVGIAPARVPLPLELSEDGPIFVNAKQFPGIMRRRQARAKLEAQNKLIKNRKPYLHESRHQHALNRVRGSGGRFLPTQKQQNSKLNRTSSSHDHENGKISEFETRQKEKGRFEQPLMASSSNMTHRDDTIYQQGFSGISSQTWEMRGNGEFLSNGNYDRASIMR